MPFTPLTEDLLPATLACWRAHQERIGTPTGARLLADREAIVAQRLRATLRSGGVWARAAVSPRDGAVRAYLAGRDRQVSRTSPYRAYVPDRFINIGADEWAVADVGDTPLLADLYAGLAAWGVSRGADAHQLAIAAGDDCSDFWLDLRFARHDCYAFLPAPVAIAGTDRAPATHLTMRRACLSDIAAASELALGEARFHHQSPIFTFAPPGLEAARHRELRESLAASETDDHNTLVLLAEAEGRTSGLLSGYFLPNVPFWAPATLPAPSFFIGSAFVHPEARGRGILRALVAATAHAVLARGADALFVTFLPSNVLAARAWRGLGFRPLQTIHQRVLDPRATRQIRSVERGSRHGEDSG